MLNSTKCGIYLIVALSLLTSNVLALSNSSNNSIGRINNSSQDIKLAYNVDEPVGIGIYINFIPYTHKELSRHSDTIVIGTVKEILPSRWNTKDGKQPNKTITELNPTDELIYTDIIINVDKYLKNPLASQEVIVRVINGTVRNFSMTSDAEPKFERGEKVLLYLSKDTNPSTKNIGPEHFIVTNFFRGKFTLTDDGKAIGTDENTTLDDLLSAIRQTDKKAPFISSIWVLAALIGAVPFVRQRQK